MVIIPKVFGINAVNIFNKSSSSMRLYLFNLVITKDIKWANGKTESLAVSAILNYA